MLGPQRLTALQSGEPGPTLVHFQLVGGVALEIFIGMGLFWWGAVIGSKYGSVPKLVGAIGEAHSWPASLQVSLTLLILLSVALALITSFSAITSMIMLLCNRILASFARFKGRFASDSGACTKCYQKCGGNMNYTGNPCIPVTSAIVILSDPVIGMAFGEAFAAGAPAVPHLMLSSSLFAALHLAVIILRSHEARRLLKQHSGGTTS